MVKILPAVQETQVRSLGQVVSLEKEMATDSIILAWKIPQRSLAGYSPWSHKELDTTVWIHFVKNKVPIGAWVYLLVLCLVPLVYISVFVPLPFCLDECSFVVQSDIRKIGSFNYIFFFKTALPIRGLLYFHISCEFFF